MCEREREEEENKHSMRVGVSNEDCLKWRSKDLDYGQCIIKMRS